MLRGARDWERRQMTRWKKRDEPQLPTRPKDKPAHTSGLPIIRWSLRLVVHFPSSLRSQIVPVFLYLTLTVRLVLSGGISSMLRRNGWPVYRTAPFGASFFWRDIV